MYSVDIRKIAVGVVACSVSYGMFPRLEMTCRKAAAQHTADPRIGTTRVGTSRHHRRNESNPSTAGLISQPNHFPKFPFSAA